MGGGATPPDEPDGHNAEGDTGDLSIFDQADAVNRRRRRTGHFPRTAPGGSMPPFARDGSNCPGLVSDWPDAGKAAEIWAAGISGVWRLSGGAVS
ncbi:hypothetical protein BN2476_600006 [Paraburkholderia piptadeniae]|uniref:Uncharacterized protein n=1 Tax=Paraburkholderia piptadeniae TaxID=1701573 RepID=A0A1N7SK52_9BURK|nr:hypothetical protein BN2476_600006 [Paraburkholderia piptadeniae]